MRGLSDAYGSWKMICISLRSGRSSPRESPMSSRPSNVTLPFVASVRRRMTRPAVVLPEPDSPTSPSVSPRRISKSMPSTARTSATWRWKMPAVMGKYL